MIRYTILSVICGAMLLALSGCNNMRAEQRVVRDAAFEYREIYLPEGNSKEGAQLGLNSVDTDWGIWGHNLWLMLPAQPSQTIYAKRNGQTVHDQFCFMSDQLYEYFEKYIDNTFGDADGIRFAILPNDNNIVCTCPKCRAAGNTSTDASPAVFDMVRRLATRFPNHYFFTSHYRTTSSIPTQHMPENTGVLISTMDYPFAAVATPKEAAFERLLAAWATKTDRIYIWDYVNNFDDYFTPFPVFEVMQRRLQLYLRNGVKGVFFNGSGTDYSSLSRLKTHILALLTENPSNDWRSLLKSLCEDFYPVTGETIADFMIAQEDYAIATAKELPLYDGVQAALKTYLPEEAFNVFYNNLQTLKHDAGRAEREEISLLCSAIELTRLEMMRLSGNIEDCKPMLEDLAKLSKKDIDVYNEGCWTIDSYIRDYTFMYNHAEAMNGIDRLKGVKLTPLNKLDPDYSDISILTDGLLGLPSNYHCGNLISSADPSLTISVPYVDGMQHLRVCLVRNPAYRIAFPQQVILKIGGVKLASYEPEKLATHSGHSFVDFELPPVVKGPITVTLVRNPEVSTMAIDEIESY